MENDVRHKRSLVGERCLLFDSRTIPFLDTLKESEGARLFCLGHKRADNPRGLGN